MGPTIQKKPRGSRVGAAACSEIFHARRVGLGGPIPFASILGDPTGRYAVEWRVRTALEGDHPELLELYRRVARVPGHLARMECEVSADFVEGLLRDAIGRGLALVLLEASEGRIVGLIHASQGVPESLRHVMGSLTILVHPGFQNRGGGKLLFSQFLGEIKAHRPQVLRVELSARASNAHALRMYESLGFAREGLFSRRIQGARGELEDGIPMAWINPAWRRETALPAEDPRQSL